MNHTITVTCDCGWVFRDTHDCPTRITSLETTRAERLYRDPTDDAPEDERHG